MDLEDITIERFVSAMMSIVVSARSSKMSSHTYVMSTEACMFHPGK